MHEPYQRTAPVLLGVAVRMVKDRQTAEDVLQDAYLNVWRFAHVYSTALSPPLAWMSLIVRNRALDVVRERGRRSFALHDDIDEGPALASTLPTPDALAQRSQQVTLLAYCLEMLAEAQRQPIFLAYLDDLSHVEIAARLKQPLGTVKTRIRRGLLNLRECFQRGGSSKPAPSRAQSAKYKPDATGPTPNPSLKRSPDGPAGWSGRLLSWA